MNNFREVIDKAVEESRLQIAHSAGHLAVAHESFANDYLLNVLRILLVTLRLLMSHSQMTTFLM
ncbi:hypothetical protein [Acinetobacter baumannii]|uniref:hypothetical protein n=1 Tax=Acinetobacter baumannii TaxID=470 RepID=UPI001D194B04|nr:hypothetical protein [Acinetobacter baumannii]